MNLVAAPSAVQLGRIAARLAKHVESALAPLDISPSQYRVLGVLADRGSEGASMLARAAAISQPSLTALIDGLVERGLVERRRDERDGRRVDLRIARKGRSALIKADRAIAERLTEIAGHLEPVQERRLLETFDLWRDALDEYRSVNRAANEKS
jgi:DNA-binding MarR family transcriptional regulator